MFAIRENLRHPRHPRAKKSLRSKQKQAAASFQRDLRQAMACLYKTPGAARNITVNVMLVP
jgi:hypothetical protein